VWRPGAVLRPCPLQLLRHLTADEEAAQDEEQIDAGPAVLKERRVPRTGWGELRAHRGPVVANDQDDGCRAQQVQRRNGGGWRHEQRTERAPWPTTFVLLARAPVHARWRGCGVRKRGATGGGFRQRRPAGARPHGAL